MDISKWSDLTVDRVAIALQVRNDKTSPLHSDRPNHGLIMNCRGIEPREYRFSDGRSFVTGEYDVFYLPKNSTYTVVGQRDSELAACYAINFDAELNDTPFKLSFRNPEAVMKLFRRAERAWRVQGEMRECQVKECIYGIVCLMSEESEREYSPSSRRNIIAPALDMIADRLGDCELRVSDLAEASGVSEVYLRRIFRTVYGLSPREYLIGLRLDYARQLLSTGQFSVTAAARAVGYSEPTHFTREFVRRFGYPPIKSINN